MQAKNHNSLRLKKENKSTQMIVTLKRNFWIYQMMRIICWKTIMLRKNIKITQIRNPSFLNEKQPAKRKRNNKNS